MMRLKTKKNQKGFTIVELLIATSTFSFILLVITVGIVQIGKNYYKGVTSSRTQEATRSFKADLTGLVQTGAYDQLGSTPATNPNYIGAFCFGNIRYTYVLNKELASPVKHVVWKDIMKVNSPCTAIANLTTADTPADGNTETVVGTKSNREMLTDHMRLAAFNISKDASNPGLFRLEIKAMYGADDVIDTKGTPAFGDDICRPSNQGGQFCASSYVNSFVKRRLL
jgi:type II secretory pathway pseudopilin PulG